MKTNLIVAIVFLLISSLLSAQATSSIRGTVKDDKNEGIPFVNIVLNQNGVFAKGGQTDFDGNYEIGPLDSGKYELEASYVGYKTARTENIVVRGNAATVYSFKMDVEGDSIGEIVILEYKVPLVKTTPISGQILTQEDFINRCCYDVSSNSSNSQRPSPTDEGRYTYSAGTRDDTNSKYVIVYRESLNLNDFFGEPTTAIVSEQKNRLATDRDANMLRNQLPYTDTLEGLASWD